MLGRRNGAGTGAGACSGPTTPVPARAPAGAASAPAGAARAPAGTPATTAAHAHPVFARVYALIAALGERGAVGRARSDLLAGVTGRLLIVGLGPGHDLAHLPPGVRQVVAIEPSPVMLAQARPRVRELGRRGVRVTLTAAVAEALPLPDGSVDAVLCAFVLCSVDDPAAALAEVRRVLRPGGRVLLLEHIRGPAGGLLARVQTAVDPAWHYLAGGCSCARDTRSSLRAAGFDDSALREVWMANFPLCVYHLYGAAPAPSATPPAGTGPPAASTAR